MKHRFLYICLACLLALTMLVPLTACTGAPAPAETTAAPGTDTPDTADTPSTTEAETENPLPTDISLPDAYAAADVVYECDDDSILHAYNGKTEEDFNAVCDYYKSLGFAVYSDTTKVGSRFTTLVGDGPMAHVYWLKDTGELNIVISETAASTLPPVTPAVTDGDYECTVVQFKDNGNVNGMAYVVQLKDGSYIVYDGSYSSQARRIQKYLTTNYTGEGKPIIRAWILTHSHNDHFPSFQTFCRHMSSTATVEHVIFSPLNDETFTMDDEQFYFSSPEFKEDVAKLSGAKVVYAHTGMEFTFCNLKLEILMTPETLFKNSDSFGNFNDTSVVTRLYDESYSALFLGDIASKGSERMVSLYGDYLKSNICQVSHHGVEDVPLSFYEIVQAPILYYPCNIWLYDQTERHWGVRTALEKRDYTKEILIAGCGEYKRAWGTTFDADADLVIPDHPTKGPAT